MTIAVSMLSDPTTHTTIYKPVLLCMTLSELMCNAGSEKIVVLTNDGFWD